MRWPCKLDTVRPRYSILNELQGLRTPCFPTRTEKRGPLESKPSCAAVNTLLPFVTLHYTFSALQQPRTVAAWILVTRAWRRGARGSSGPASPSQSFEAASALIARAVVWRGSHNGPVTPPPPLGGAPHAASGWDPGAARNGRGCYAAGVLASGVALTRWHLPPEASVWLHTKATIIMFRAVPREYLRGPRTSVVPSVGN